MNGVNISWYLSGLFLFALIVNLAVSVAPGADPLFNAVRAVLAGCSVLFAGVAFYLARLRRSQSSTARKRRWAVNVYLGFAVLATLLVLCLAAG